MALPSKPSVQRQKPVARDRATRGVTLVEALVALLVMSFGMVALIQLMTNLRRAGDLAKQRTEAMLIAKQDLSKLRSYSQLNRPNGTPTTVVAYSDIVTDSWTVQPANSNVSYSVLRTVSDLQQPAAVSVDVNVSWTDRAGENQTVTLNSIIAREDPAFGGALRVKPDFDAIRPPLARNLAVPGGAKDLGGSESGYKPIVGGTTAFVFDNVTGAVIKTCSISSALTTAALQSSDLTSTNCVSIPSGYAISGTVRFSYSGTASSENPNDNALPVAVMVELPNAGVGYPAAPVACYTDAGSTIKIVNYICVVQTETGSTPASWSGVLKMTSALAIGLAANQYRVCRYSYDSNGNSVIDNAEHPATYTKVATSLARQNFLIIKGTETCPVDAVGINPSIGKFINYSTAQLQP